MPSPEIASAYEPPAIVPAADSRLASPTVAPKPSGFGWRWVICGLLFFATTINYMDRVTMSVLESTLQKDIGWSDSQWGYINGSFLLAYALGSVLAGWMMDKLGARLGYAVALVFWSIISAAHAFAGNVTAFVGMRFALGLGEAGNFPGAIKATAEWFPKRERALATGIFNSGSNVGQIIAAGAVPILALNYGWQAAFIVTGLVGLLWVVVWLPLYRRPTEHARISPAELAYIESDPPDRMEKMAWKRILPFRQTWAFAAGKFMTDSIWWFYVFWFPKFMHDTFPEMDLKHIGLPMVTVYVMATIGSIFGGWQSSWLLSRGWTTNAARKTAMLTCAYMRSTGSCRSIGERPLGGGGADWFGHGGASRVLVQYVYTGLRYVSAKGGWFGGGLWHVCRRDGGLSATN